MSGHSEHEEAEVDSWDKLTGSSSLHYKIYISFVIGKI